MEHDQSSSLIPPVQRSGIECGSRSGPSSVERRRLTEALVAELQRCEGGERCRVRQELVLVNRCVADSIAGRYGGRGLQLEDIRQVAREALVKAVLRFDPDSGADLLSFAVPTITGEIKRHFRDHGWMVRPPRRIQELQQRVGRAVDELRQETDRDPTREEVAARLGVTLREYDAAQEAYGCFSPTSLDQPRTEGGRTWGEALEGENRASEAAEARVMLEPLVRRLPARDRRILYLRFFEDRTQSEIGEDLGITQTQVSRLLAEIYGTLRESLGDPLGPETPQGCGLVGPRRATERSRAS